MKDHRRWQCVGCRYQVSLTVGTILHNTKTPLTAWFWATYLTVIDKGGMSALLLQRQLGLRRYETAWMLLHLRRALVKAARQPLQGDVEIEFPDFKATTLMAFIKHVAPGSTIYTDG